MWQAAASLGRRLERSWNGREWKEVNGRDRANAEGVAVLRRKDSISRFGVEEVLLSLRSVRVSLLNHGEELEQWSMTELTFCCKARADAIDTLSRRAWVWDRRCGGLDQIETLVGEVNYQLIPLRLPCKGN